MLAVTSNLVLLIHVSVAGNFRHPLVEGNPNRDVKQSGTSEQPEVKLQRTANRHLWIMLA